jgi:hypothetical protein
MLCNSDTFLSAVVNRHAAFSCRNRLMFRPLFGPYKSLSFQRPKPTMPLSAELSAWLLFLHDYS